MKVLSLDYNKTKALQIYLNRFGVPTPINGVADATLLNNYRQVLKKLTIKDTDELTEAIEIYFSERVFKMDVDLGILPRPVEPKPGDKVNPVYWKPGKFHPRFEHLLPAPYTHLHPYDVLRSVAGEKEIPGPKHNPLIQHFHEHSLNLGRHDEDGTDYADEVPHCASAMNWSNDGAGCKKTNNALASSHDNYPGEKRKKGQWVRRGDLVRLRDSNHITFAEEDFLWDDNGNFPGFGSNQGNTIKVSIYPKSRIVTVHVVTPLPGTVLAPIGFLGEKPMPATGTINESTR